MRLGLVTGYSDARMGLPMDTILEAEKAGFDSVWTAEAYGSDAITPLSWIAALTKKIRLGTGIMQMPARTPATTAMTAMTLDALSGGRFILGIGPSGPQVVEGWHGVPYGKPLQRTREYVEIIKMILRREKLVYHGEFFNLERGFKLRFTPLRADLPIYIAAMGPKNVVQSGEIADGVLPVYWPGDKWGEMRETLDEGARLAGRPPHSTAIAPIITSVILDENANEHDRAAARLFAAAPLAYYIGRMGVYYSEMLTRHGYGAEVAVVQEAWKHKDKNPAEAVAPELLEATSIVGTPKEVVAKLDQWAASGVDEPLLGMPEGSVDEVGAKLSALMDALRA